jgi:F-type H+-transporting ATPase subunit b
MGDLLSQLANLLLRAIPTALLFALVWFAYRTILDGKLTEVLSRRRERTEGAMEKARADIAAADARSAEYERRVREAKAAMYTAQEARRRKQLEARVAAVTEARKAAQTRAESAAEELSDELTRAKAQLHTNVDPFVNQIIARILKRAPVTESIESTVGRA